MNYYYLIASLPSLSIDAPPAVSLEDFQDLCRSHLTPDDFKVLEALLNSDSQDSSHPFVEAWRDRETQIRNAIARQRASRLKCDPASYLREQQDFDSLVEKLAADAFAKTDPLEREQALDKLRWSSIEELAGFDPFTGRAVLAYTLKLLLAKRWDEMNKEKGTKKSNDIVNHDPNRNEEETNNE